MKNIPEIFWYYLGIAALMFAVFGGSALIALAAK